ncbi:MAG TPA: ATP-dependent sacrificial sulfur transferase LarE [Candidatus Dormibacteraeota bacterium]|nr:ATP-dependent sacrificial sulfur transferase LarE [Candidatus Dormibacteraeota bacterium]
MDVEEKLDAVRERLRGLGSVLVAFSGGADSALVLALAHGVLGDRAAGAIGLSAAYPETEVASARATAAHIGTRLLEVPTAQLADPDFLRNDAGRCYHCRDDLYTILGPLAAEHRLAVICDGTNADDLGDIRPGQRAAREAGVVSPLAEAGVTKAEVRAASRALGLPTWDKPQQACLSSRIPRGTPITLTALRRVERAEAWLRDQGIVQLRVREHGECARIEVEDVRDIVRLATEPLRGRCVAALRELGYAFVSLDLEGFATGRMNRLLAPEELGPLPAPPRR